MQNLKEIRDLDTKFSDICSLMRLCARGQNVQNTEKLIRRFLVKLRSSKWYDLYIILCVLNVKAIQDLSLSEFEYLLKPYPNQVITIILTVFDRIFKF